MAPETKVSCRALGAWLLGLVLVPRLVDLGAATDSEDSATGTCVVIGVGGDVLPESSWSGPQVFPHIHGMREEFAATDLVFVPVEISPEANHRSLPGHESPRF